MSGEKLTNAEARRLLEMLKHTLMEEMNFPNRGEKKEFDVVGDTKKDLFTVSIFRGRIQPKKYSIGARVKKNGISLLELHINATNVHFNPDGEKITKDHWHIYTEEYGRKFAIPAEDICDEKFVENTLIFLRKFHVVEPPKLYYQTEL